MIVFVCASYVQTIRAFQMHSEMDEFKQDADLFLVNPMFNDVELINRFRKVGFFRNVYYIDTLAGRKAATLKYMYGKKYGNILRKYSYDKVVSFNVEEIVAQALYNLNKRQPGFEFHCVEDCPNAYNVYLPSNFTWKHPYKWLGIDKPFYKIKNWWTSCPELMDFPEKCTFEVRKLSTINIENRNLLNILNYIYGYRPDEVLDKADCLIMEESHYTDGLMIDNKDYHIYKAILKRYPYIRFAIKLHPRTTKNRFKGMLPVIKNSKVPWELIIWNRIISRSSELVLMSIVCGTMVSDKFMFGYEGSKLLLIKLFKNSIKKQGAYCRISDELISKYEKIKQGYRLPEQFLLPETEDELYKILDEKWEIYKMDK